MNSWPKRREILIGVKNREFAKEVLGTLCDRGRLEIDKGNADGLTFAGFILALLETCVEPEMGLPDWEIKP